MSVVTAAISVDEYLATSFDPDCDYVDGQVLERNVGQREHSYTQGRLYAWFDRYGSGRFEPWIEQRLQIRPGRFRIPDLAVVPVPRPRERVFTSPPYLCVEVSSPDDKLTDLQDRIDDYIEMGVPNIWVIDPWKRRAWSVTATGWHTAPNLTLTTSDGSFELPVEQVLLPPGE